MSIKDAKNEAVILNDRSQGGTSLKKGELELMIHRYIVHDDGRGVDEGLHDYKPLRMKHYLMFLDANSDKNQARIVQYHLDLQPVVMLSSLKNKDKGFIPKTEDIKLDIDNDFPSN